MVATSLGRQRAVLSLTTRFCLPHEGMTQLEYLSRGSAFLLDGAAMPQSSPPSGRPQPSPLLDNVKILTCQHVACPWLFPNYFADKWDWLQHVSEEFVQHSLQLLELPDEEDGDSKSYRPKVLLDIPLTQRVWLHPERDLAMLAMNHDDEARWKALVHQWQLRALALNPIGSTPGDLVLFTGHKQLQSDAASDASTESSDSSSSDDDEAVGQYPKQVYGRFVGQSSKGQAFAWSEEILEEGMCGGAVVDANGNCVGLIEGIVPPYNPAKASEDAVLSSDASEEERDAAAAAAATARMQKALENHVAFVPSRDIHEFLHDGARHSVLTGLALL